MLDSGTRLGPYEIVASIGAGGMGEVYRAKDTRIDRTVAIKVLPSTLAGDPELKQRFEREAKSISSLNHPHICTLYEFDSHEGTDFLVMEHLEGESLAERIQRKGALPLDEALPYAVQIAEALDVAHRQGVIHRDLKPGNIMLTARGAMLLDFGLAKLAAPSESADLSVLSAVPTRAQPLTEKGAILGTFQYMAPEQLEGKEADARTDVFAFGAVVHEMVTGKKAFEGRSQASLIGAILERDPLPVSSLRPLAPPALDRIVKKCLAKNPAERYYSTHDLADELGWLGGPEVSVATSGRGHGLQGRRGIPLGILVGALVTGAALWSSWPSSTERQVTRFSIPVEGALPPITQNIAIEADGARLAYVANNRLFVRELDALDARPLNGIEGRPRSPTFSPDGKWIAFWDGDSGQLKKVAIAGGAPLRLSEIDEPYGLVWGEDEVIRFGSAVGIQQVPASGGTPEIVLQSSEPIERPQRLPDGRSYVFSMGDGPNVANYRIGVWAPGDESPEVVFEGSDNVHYLPSGQLLFHGRSDLLAAAFDPSTRELIGSPIPVIEDSGFQFDVSGNGTLLYQSGVRMSAMRLVWVDRNGGVSPAVDERRAFYRPRLSPDGREVVLEVREPEGNQRDLWVYDLERGTRTRVTADADLEQDPLWSPDGERIVFGSTRGGVQNDIFSRSADGTGEITLLVKSDVAKDPHSFSPDGRFLAYYERKAEGRDIWIFDLEEGKAKPFAVTEFNERSPSFSPDGRFIAYTSDASGRDEVYVQPFPGPGPRTVVSTDGGREPLWSRDGHELFYRNGDRMMAVAVEAGAGFHAGMPETLFSGKFLGEPNAESGSHTYDVSPDGQRFLMVEQGDQHAELRVVVNWLDELQARVPHH